MNEMKNYYINLLYEYKVVTVNYKPVVSAFRKTSSLHVPRQLQRMTRGYLREKKLPLLLRKGPDIFA
uniref:Uncharacterized protein n=1 Tax=Arundo donax TaxID=35708 RepID=A0A0A8YQC4_ARUDO